MKDLKEIDLQKAEEEDKHNEIERIGSEDSSDLRESDPDPHRCEDHKKKNKIIFLKQYRILC